MGSRIEAVVAKHGRRGPLPPGALRLTDRAARACLARAGRRASEVDLLVNAGLYKEHTMAEPALASIIQEDIGANPGHPPRHDRHGTFSFDVMNGGCGVVTALALVDAFVATHAIGLGLVVAGDADPGTSRGFPFAPAAGAVLLEPSDGREGFERFVLRTFPEHAGLFDARLQWEADVGRNVVEIRVGEEFARVCVELAIGVARETLEGEPDLLVTSQYPRGFGDGVARGLGLDERRVAHVAPALEETHTAGPIAALEAAVASGAFASARRVLFVTAGAGVTIGVATYVRE